MGLIVHLDRKRNLFYVQEVALRTRRTQNTEMRIQNLETHVHKITNVLELHDFDSGKSITRAIEGVGPENHYVP